MDVACNDYMVRSSAHTYTYSLCLDETQQYLSEPMAVVAVAIYTGIEHRIVQSSKSSKSIHQPIPTINGTTPHLFFCSMLACLQHGFSQSVGRVHCRLRLRDARTDNPILHSGSRTLPSDALGEQSQIIAQHFGVIFISLGEQFFPDCETKQRRASAVVHGVSHKIAVLLITTLAIPTMQWSDLALTACTPVSSNSAAEIYRMIGRENCRCLKLGHGFVNSFLFQIRLNSRGLIYSVGLLLASVFVTVRIQSFVLYFPKSHFIDISFTCSFLTSSCSSDCKGCC